MSNVSRAKQCQFQNFAKSQPLNAQSPSAISKRDTPTTAHIAPIFSIGSSPRASGFLRNHPTNPPIPVISKSSPQVQSQGGSFPHQLKPSVSNSTANSIWITPLCRLSFKNSRCSSSPINLIHSQSKNPSHCSVRQD